uniref:Uncharacterized protein n=1 Tax=Rhizophora mucronata TaxID=61149 RepID=A0A2P2QWD8_RHIMU
MDKDIIVILNGLVVFGIVRTALAGVSLNPFDFWGYFEGD